MPNLVIQIVLSPLNKNITTSCSVDSYVQEVRNALQITIS